MEALPGFIVAALALAGSPGPNTLSLAAAAGAFGSRRSLPFMLGIGVGMAGVLAITASGVTSLVLAVPMAAHVIAVAAAVYFLYLAYRIATAPPLTDDSAARNQPSFLAGVFLSLVNPKGYAAMAALFSGFVLVKDRPDLDVALKLSVVLAVIVAVNIAWLMAGAALTRFFRDPRTNRIVNVAFAVALLASVAAALLV
jgi:threonine/homoserine/homoserine lactone efflux protein